MTLYGLYNSEDNLISVHKTEAGAEENKLKHEKRFGDGFYVDFVVVHN